MLGRLRSRFGNLSGPKKVATVVVAVATGVGAVVAAVNGSIDLYKKLTEARTAAESLELVDVGFTPHKQQPSNVRQVASVWGYSAHELCDKRKDACLVPALDFKVANTGDNTVFIKRADLQVNKIWTFKAPYDSVVCDYLYAAPSHNYDIRLPVKETPYTVSKTLSQTVEPHGTDRFTVTPHRDDRTAEFGQDYVFLMTVSLVYGVDSVVTSKDMLYGELQTGYGAFYSYHPGTCVEANKSLDKSDIARLTKQNEQAAAEIKNIEAPSNRSLSELLQEVSTVQRQD